jgi:hypothetical protein
MKGLLFLMLLTALSGCSTVEINDGPPSFCGNAPFEQWQVIPAPVDADVLRSLADAKPNFPAGTGTYPIEHWFSGQGSERMLCRRDKSSCSGEWWVFRQSDSGPLLHRQDAWICVTGVRPNKSFKPTPLRGAA